MRKLRTNEAGIVVPARSQIHTGSPIKALRNPSQALRRIEKIKAGHQLRIAINRSAGGLGDVLMTLPTVKQIKKQYSCIIDYVTDFDYLDGALPKVLQGNPHIDHILDYRDITEEDKEVYDAWVDLCCPCTVHEQPHAEPINRIDLFARHAGVGLSDTQIDYCITQQEFEWAQEWIAARNLGRNKLFMVQPHSSTSRRDLPPERLQHTVANIIANNKDYKAVIILHDTDTKKLNWNLYGTYEFKNYDVRHIAALMFYCDLVICQDSSILHLAGAIQKKTLTLFGPTDPRARVNYYPNAVAIWPGGHLHCCPSWYSNTCNGAMTCWKLIEESVITNTALTLLANQPLPDDPDLVFFGSQTKGTANTLSVKI